MQTPVVLTEVAGTSRALGPLFDAAGFHLDHRADTIAIALGATKLTFNQWPTGVVTLCSSVPGAPRFTIKASTRPSVS